MANRLIVYLPLSSWFMLTRYRDVDFTKSSSISRSESSTPDSDFSSVLPPTLTPLPSTAIHHNEQTQGTTHTIKKHSSPNSKKPQTAILSNQKHSTNTPTNQKNPQGSRGDKTHLTSQPSNHMSKGKLSANHMQASSQSSTARFSSNRIIGNVDTVDSSGSTLPDTHIVSSVHSLVPDTNYADDADVQVVASGNSGILWPDVCDPYHMNRELQLQIGDTVIDVYERR